MRMYRLMCLHTRRLASRLIRPWKLLNWLKLELAMCDLTELGNMALRNIITSASKELLPDEWVRGYFRGQISTINCYMTPDAALLKAAERAVDALITGKQNKEPS